MNSHGFSPPFVQVSRCENLNAALKVSELRLEPGLAVGIECGFENNLDRKV